MPNVEADTKTTGELMTAIRHVRDEVTVKSFALGRSQANRSLALAITALDQAEGWLLRFGVETGSHLVVDKNEYAAALDATANRKPRTDATDTTDVSGGLNV